jgi:hypothetical protein
MNLADLAAIMGKSISEVEAMLKEQDTVEVQLTEKKKREKKEECVIDAI